MRILILRDGRPGHFRQSEGVALALGRRAPVLVERLDVEPRLVFRGRFARRVLARVAPPAAILRLVYGLDPGAIGEPDLIVSAGADTMLVNIAAARLRGVPNIFIGSLRGLAEEAFTAILHTVPSVAARPRHVLVLKPSAFDPDTLPVPRRLGQSMDLFGAGLALLVGGPSRSHSWRDKDWDALIALVEDTFLRHGVVWTVATSRRTPPAVADQLAALCVPDGAIGRFIDYRSAGAGSADALFGADAIVVTEDSNMMMMEAVSARRPVVALVPPRRRPTADDEATERLERERRLVRLQLADATPRDLVAAILAAEPLSENPLDDLTDRLAPMIAAATKPRPLS